MLDRLCATSVWRDDSRSATSPSRWEPGADSSRPTRKPSPISKVASTHRKARSGTRPWNTGRHSRVVTTQYSTANSTSRPRISNQWSLTEPTRAWVWASPSPFQNSTPSTRRVGHLSSSRSTTWDSNRERNSSEKRWTTCSSGLAPTDVSKTSVCSHTSSRVRKKPTTSRHGSCRDRGW